MQEMNWGYRQTKKTQDFCRGTVKLVFNQGLSFAKRTKIPLCKGGRRKASGGFMPRIKLKQLNPSCAARFLPLRK